jgi:hypothetical protein
MTQQDSNNLPQDNEVNPSEMDKTNSRRGFFKKAAIGSALITTVASKPVWANQCTLSGNLSNNTSNHDETTHCALSGFSHGGWKANRSMTGAARSYYGVMKGLNGVIINVDSKISVLFGGSAPNITIQQALDKVGATGYNTNFLAQITAAALNAALWQCIKAQCEDGSCSIASLGIDNRFYWPKTVEDYRNDFISLQGSKPAQSSYATAIAAFYF